MADFKQLPLIKPETVNIDGNLVYYLNFGTYYTVAKPLPSQVIFEQPPFTTAAPKTRFSINMQDPPSALYVAESQVTPETFPQVGDRMIINCSAYGGLEFQDIGLSQYVYEYNSATDEVKPMSEYGFLIGYVYTITYVGLIKINPADLSTNPASVYAVTVGRAAASEDTLFTGDNNQIII
jgi:hypothetical protein